MYHHEHQKKDIRRLVMLTKSVFYDWETDSVEKLTSKLWGRSF